MKFLKKMIFGVRKPNISNHDRNIEKHKKKIEELFKYCLSRFDSIEILIEKSSEEDIASGSSIDDAIILFERAILDLIRLALLIYEKEEIASLENIESVANEIPNKRVSQYLIDIKNLYDEWNENPSNVWKLKDKTRVIREKLFSGLYRSYDEKRKTKLFTKVDKYKKQIRLRRRILLFSLISIIILVCGPIYYFYVPGVDGNVSINDNKELIVDGKKVPIVSKSCGFLDRVDVKDVLLSRRRVLAFSGWCGDVNARVASKSVIIFIDDIFVAKGLVDIDRVDVASTVCPELLKSGFGFSVNVNKKEVRKRSFLRAFALLPDNTACELIYGKSLPFRP